MTKTSSRCSPEVRTRAARMVLEHQADHPSQWAATCEAVTRSSSSSHMDANLSILDLALAPEGPSIHGLFDRSTVLQER